MTDDRSCPTCGTPIVRGPKEKLGNFRVRVYCSRQCSYGRKTTQRLDDINMLLEAGESVTAIALRLGVTCEALSRWLRRYGHNDKACLFDKAPRVRPKPNMDDDHNCQNRNCTQPIVRGLESPSRWRARRFCSPRCANSERALQRKENPVPPLNQAASRVVNLETPNLPQANCVGSDPEAFFVDTSIRPAAADMAKRICGDCVERSACLTWALPIHDLRGIWGGKTEDERRQMRRRRRDKRQPVAA